MAFPVSVWSAYFEDVTIEEAIDRFIIFGFYHTELCIPHTEAVATSEIGPERAGTALAAYAKERGFSISQGHLTFDKGVCTESARDLIKKELDMYQAAGIKNAVLHFAGAWDLPEQEQYEARLEGVRKIVEYVKGTDITICLENLGSIPATHTAEKLKDLITKLGGSNLGICLDIGHLHLTNGKGYAKQSQSEFIHSAGSLLKALHVTNNSGVSDVHLMPYSSRYGVDYVEVVRALKDIDYSGLFNLEILGETVAPDFIKFAKLRYIKEMTDYMMSEEFLKN